MSHLKRYMKLLLYAVLKYQVQNFKDLHLIETKNFPSVLSHFSLASSISLQSLKNVRLVSIILLRKC